MIRAPRDVRLTALIDLFIYIEVGWLAFISCDKSVDHAPSHNFLWQKAIPVELSVAFSTPRTEPVRFKTPQVAVSCQTST